MLKKSLEVLEVIKVKKKNYEIAIKNAKKVFKNIETKYSKSDGNNLSKCWKKYLKKMLKKMLKRCSLKCWKKCWKKVSKCWTIFEINPQENVENMFLKVLKKCWKKCWNAESVESAESA